ncbi:MAG TPA: FAD-dependent oxidoreductase [Arenicellales bacterium]|nr:FAD-dependent oxidoreductase [Arenicellales bacterium]
MRDSRYDLLFEPAKIGPVTAKNRFYQVPHCAGMGWLRPKMAAAMRGMKAEGGWGVVCTEWCSIHPTSDDLPHPNAALWNQDHIRDQALMTEAVHNHGALAGVELWFGGASSANHYTRETAIDLTSIPNLAGHPYQTRAMDKSDIRELRRWHREAALRAKEADFDIVYVYATHGYLISHFLSARTNRRSDEYGGSMENRTRLLRELIEDTKDAVGDRCAVAVRYSVGGDDGESTALTHERRDRLEMLAELPDLWDININNYYQEMGVSRFIKEASLEEHMSFVKSVTTKPVVTVGRFTSPDTMVSQVRRGIVDFIGAARPSIADPFLPKKIEEGRPENIRECIGCNICYTGDGMGTPIRCTQNPTMGEEWRRGWHPEFIAKKTTDTSVLVTGAGPAGLEAARALGQRGYQVMLAEATRELGGRVARESGLPGLGEWRRVRDYRLGQIDKMPNVEIFRESELSVDEVLSIGTDHVAIATGASWRSDGFGRSHPYPLDTLTSGANILTPDDIMAGRMPDGPAVVYDDDSFYMGGAIAEKLRRAGLPVTLVTPENVVSAWCEYTSEQYQVQKNLLELGVKIETAYSLLSYDGSDVMISCTHTEHQQAIKADALIMVTARQPNDELYQALNQRLESESQTLFRSLRRIGDCEAPAIIAAAVYAGHRYARELDTDPDPDVPFKLE